MRTILLFFVAVLIALTGCTKDEEFHKVNLKEFEGTWELVEQGTQNEFVRGSCLIIQTSENFEYQQCGSIETVFYTANGIPKYDKAYKWSIHTDDLPFPTLEVTTNDGKTQQSFKYNITVLNGQYMWWQDTVEGKPGIIKFKRASTAQQLH